MVSRIAREPFVHFVFLGLLLFIASHHLEQRTSPTPIIITPEHVQHLVQVYSLQTGLSPSPEQEEALVDRWVMDEMFYREALSLGLDENDEIVRRRLVQKYEFLLEDLFVREEPTEYQLLEYYREHPDLYQIPKVVTFAHTYFSPDIRGETQARQAALEFVTDSNHRGVIPPVSGGDEFPAGDNFRKASHDELTSIFGQHGLAQRIWDVELNHWSGPIRSGLGWHAVYVRARAPSQSRRFQDARADVLLDYRNALRDRGDTEALNKLRLKYSVVRQ